MPLVTLEKYLDQDEQILHADFKKTDLLRKVLPAIGILAVLYLLYTFAFNNYTKNYISNIQGPLKYVYLLLPLILIGALTFGIIHQTKNKIFVTNKGVIVTTMFTHQKMYFKKMQTVVVQSTEYFGGLKPLIKNIISARHYVRIQGNEKNKQIIHNGGSGMSKQYAEILQQTIVDEASRQGIKMS